MDARAPAIAMAAAILLAGCAGRPAPAPAPAPVAPPVSPPPSTPPPPEPAAEAWLERVLTPGEWTYADGEARFAGFSLRCERGQGRIVLAREGVGGALRMRTTYGERTFASGASVPAADPLLDEMAFSRGRFAVEAQGAEPLVIPAWPEAGRVIEDCRG
jgi:hypothetical protein